MICLVIIQSIIVAEIKKMDEVTRITVRGTHRLSRDCTFCYHDDNSGDCADYIDSYDLEIINESRTYNAMKIVGRFAQNMKDTITMYLLYFVQNL